MTKGKEEGYLPTILGFLCKWCSYAGADLAGTSRIKYPASIRIVKLPCSGRVDPVFVIKALRMGYDAVLISGCHPGDCHYQTGNYRFRRRIALTFEFLSYMGIERKRMWAHWVSASEGGKFADIVKITTDEVSRIGRNRMFEDARGGDRAKA
jgi:coenzyme F420-reducing hydrogenase delta subunit